MATNHKVAMALSTPCLLVILASELNNGQLKSSLKDVEPLLVLELHKMKMVNLGDLRMLSLLIQHLRRKQ